MPGVVAFTGHMVDRPTRSNPRFPPQAEPLVAKRIAEELERLGAAIGYASAACGGDILFHEAMLRRGGKIHVVLPCPKEEFRGACIDIIPDSDWGDRFERVLAQADSIEYLSEQCAADNAMASECCNRVVLGLATMKALEENEQPAVLAFWDGRPGDALGGTHSLVRFCLAHNRRVSIIDALQPEKPVQVREPEQHPPRPTQASIEAEPLIQELCAIVFADVVGFSKLTERQLPPFARHYLGGVMGLMMELLKSGSAFPLVKNTWGDGLYLGFPTVRDAGLFALELSHFIRTTRWEDHGLPHGFNARIGLHAGPVYRLYDPIIGQWTYIGSHVIRTARIEPITPPGEVYASRAFAALAVAEQVREFVCVDAGEIDLAKGYGRMRAYRVIKSA
jgi:class 3 adenylate cyclase